AATLPFPFTSPPGYALPRRFLLRRRLLQRPFRLHRSSAAMDRNWIWESDLIAILQASPGLRIFYFQLRIVARSASGRERVRLADLEVLRLKPGYGSLSFPDRARAGSVHGGRD
ncbi:hypothetical protein FRC11_009693, partial [Ceratobasidium sp. 423]